MIFIAGDVGGYEDLARLFTVKDLTKDDYVVVVGKFRFIEEDSMSGMLDMISGKINYTLLLVTDSLDSNPDKYPTVLMFDDNVRKIRDNIFQLLNGRIYTIDGRRVFTFGSLPFLMYTDNGVKNNPDKNAIFHDDMNRGIANILRKNDVVDLVLTHECPTFAAQVKETSDDRPVFSIPNEIKSYFDHISRFLSYGHWYCGRYHADITIPQKNFTFIYEKIVEA